MNSRRTFFKVLAGALGAGVLFLSGKRAAAKKLGIKLDKVPALQKVGGSVKLKLEGQEILFVRESETSVRALSALCTHQECPVTYDSKKGKIDCSCHGSVFDLNGNATKGPAKKPLRSFLATLQDGSIVVTVD